MLKVEVAEKRMATINFIESADSLLDVSRYPPFRFHELKGDRSGFFAIDLGRKMGYRLIIEPVCLTTDIKDEQGFYQFQKIRIIEVQEVCNHYE